MKQKSKFGWLELIVGILLIILGAFAFANPSTAFGGMVLVYGIMAIITGIADIVLYAKLSRHMGFGPVLSLLGGIFSILAGVIILFTPGTGSLVLAVLFPIWFIAHSISRLANAGVTRVVAGKTHYIFTLIINILGLILGIMLLFNPIASMFSIGYLAGIYLIMLGVGSVVTAFDKPDTH